MFITQKRKMFLMKFKLLLTRYAYIALISIALCLLTCVMNMTPALAARTTPLPTPASGLTDPHGLETFLDGVMAAQLKDDQIPGATVSVVKDGKILSCPVWPTVSTSRASTMYT